jgi:hypothetical protein
VGQVPSTLRVARAHARAQENFLGPEPTPPNPPKTRLKSKRVRGVAHRHRGTLA